MPSDAELLLAIADRDEAALRTLIELHSAWLTLRLRRRTPDAELVAEALHDTFMAVWRNPKAFRGDGDLGAWLWGIAIRQLIGRLRRKAAPTPASDDALAAL